MAPLLEDEDDRRRDSDLDHERAGVRAPQTGEEFFDDAATASSDADDD